MTAGKGKINWSDESLKIKTKRREPSPIKEVNELSKNYGFKALRVKAGYTQYELAEALGINQCTISNWENNVTKPDILIVGKVADLMNVTIEEVVKCFM